MTREAESREKAWRLRYRRPAPEVLGRGLYSYATAHKRDEEPHSQVELDARIYEERNQVRGSTREVEKRRRRT